MRRPRAARSFSDPRIFTFDMVVETHPLLAYRSGEVAELIAPPEVVHPAGSRMPRGGTVRVRIELPPHLPVTADEIALLRAYLGEVIDRILCDEP